MFFCNRIVDHCFYVDKRICYGDVLFSFLWIVQRRIANAWSINVHVLCGQKILQFCNRIKKFVIRSTQFYSSTFDRILQRYDAVL
ncbi:hypothetical protein NPIL_260011 [Nephila pilipes]|uniref:Uncharacterized protein n=1 Tax=Nephila pilipes TaxID=299642 RepID=A0A8X6MJW9_NEPPI|nr:hypothetical protein NPIL_260011 [Nephila pilipes]